MLVAAAKVEAVKVEACPPALLAHMICCVHLQVEMDFFTIKYDLSGEHDN